MSIPRTDIQPQFSGCPYRTPPFFYAKMKFLQPCLVFILSFLFAFFFDVSESKAQKEELYIIIEKYFIDNGKSDIIYTYFDKEKVFRVLVFSEARSVSTGLELAHKSSRFHGPPYISLSWYQNIISGNSFTEALNRDGGDETLGYVVEIKKEIRNNKNILTTNVYVLSNEINDWCYVYFHKDRGDGNFRFVVLITGSEGDLAKAACGLAGTFFSLGVKDAEKLYNDMRSIFERNGKVKFGPISRITCVLGLLHMEKIAIDPSLFEREILARSSRRYPSGGC